MRRPVPHLSCLGRMASPLLRHRRRLIATPIIRHIMFESFNAEFDSFDAGVPFEYAGTCVPFESVNGSVLFKYDSACVEFESFDAVVQFKYASTHVEFESFKVGVRFKPVGV